MERGKQPPSMSELKGGVLNNEDGETKQEREQIRSDKWMQEGVVDVVQ